MRNLLPLILLGSLGLSSVAHAVPTWVGHQGRMLDSLGDPLVGVHELSFAIYDTASGGSPMWQESHSVSFDAGAYSVVLGSQTPISQELIAGGSLHLGIAVDGAPEMSPRIPIGSVPYAIWADQAGSAAELVPGAVIDAAEIRVNGTTVIGSDGTVSGMIQWSDIQGVPDELTSPSPLASLLCTEGQQPTVISGSWACAADDDHDHNAADISDGVLDINRLPVGSGSDSVAAGDHTHSYSDLTNTPTTFNDLSGCSNGKIPVYNGSSWSCGDPGLSAESDPSVNALGKATLNCSSGQVAKWNGSGWACANDADTLTTWNTLGGIPSGFADGVDNGITTESDPTVNALAKASLSCSSGQIAKWNGSAWACATDAGLTSESDPNVNALGKASLSCSSGQYASFNGSTWVCATLPAYQPITTYTRWGRTSCPSGASTVYTGWIAHGHYQHGGGPTNYYCLHDSPEYNQVNAGNQNGALLYKVEYEMSGYGLAALNGVHDYDARCVVCEVPRRTQIMIGARRNCPSGWTREYEGYLMGQHYTQAASELICVDASPEAHGSNGNQNGGLLYPTEFENGGNVPYNHDWEMTCVVCSK